MSIPTLLAAKRDSGGLSSSGAAAPPSIRASSRDPANCRASEASRKDRSGAEEGRMHAGLLLVVVQVILAPTDLILHRFALRRGCDARANLFERRDIVVADPSIEEAVEQPHLLAAWQRRHVCGGMRGSPVADLGVRLEVPRRHVLVEIARL